jgi:hypothetical protein
MEIFATTSRFRSFWIESCAFQIIDRDPTVFELALKFVLCVRTFQLCKFVFHLAIAGFEVQLLGSLEQNLVVDQLVQDVEFE